MNRIVFFLLALAVLVGLAWGDGEEIRHDPNTGVILPAGRTPAAVERERLEVEFRSHPEYPASVGTVKVRAQYWLRNPTDKPLELHIGFPAPGGAIELVEPPVRLDGQLGEWRLLSYDDLLKPMQPSLIRAMQRWADRHPEALRLAKLLRGPAHSNAQERRSLEVALRNALRAGPAARGAPPTFSPDVHSWLWPSREAPQRYRNMWTLRNAILVTGQRPLLPEGRWYVDHTVLDPATGRAVAPRDGTGGVFSMLTFPLRLRANGPHHLQVAYRQSPSKDPEGALWRFSYVLRTVRSWASFGPIETSIKAPAGLVFRSLPALRYAGMSQGLKVYRGVISQPQRNLQVVLAGREMLWPRLKINGHAWYGRHDMLVGGSPTAPIFALAGQMHAPPYLNKRFERGEVVLQRGTTILRARPGEKRMFVNERPVALRTPIVVRNGATCLPLEGLQALYPDYDVTLTYHAPSRTVLFSAKPKPKAPQSENGGPQ